MASIVFVEHNLHDILQKAVDKKYIKFANPIPFKIEVELDSKEEKSIKAHKGLVDKLSKPASEVYKKAIVKLTSVAKQINDNIAKDDTPGNEAKCAIKANNATKILNANVKKIIDEYQEEGKQAIRKEWADHIAKNKEFQRYRFNVVYKVAKGVSALTTFAITSVASGGIALIGTLKALREANSLAQTLYQEMRDLNSIKVSIHGGLDTLKKRYKNADTSNLGGLTGALKTFANTAFGADFMTTISSVKSDMKAYDQKFRGLAITADKLRDSIHDVIDQMEKETKDATKEQKKVVTDLESGMTKLLNKIDHLNDQIKDENKFKKFAESTMDEIENTEPAKWKFISAVSSSLLKIGLAPSDYQNVPETIQAMIEQAREEIKDATKRKK
jgi:vacuolar-type H+-ATPase subunit I/STV1